MTIFNYQPEAMYGCQHHVDGIKWVDEVWWKRTFLLSRVWFSNNTNIIVSHIKCTNQHNPSLCSVYQQYLTHESKWEYTNTYYSYQCATKAKTHTHYTPWDKNATLLTIWITQSKMYQT